MGTKSVDVSDEAYLTLKGLKRRGESFSDVIMRIGSNTFSPTSLIRRFSFVLWGYCLAVWLYVIAYQMRYRNGIYDTLAWWLPVRMDYIGEVAFALSFVFAIIIAVRPATGR